MRIRGLFAYADQGLVVVDDKGVRIGQLRPQARMGGLSGAAGRDKQHRFAVGNDNRAVHQQNLLFDQRVGNALVQRQKFDVVRRQVGVAAVGVLFEQLPHSRASLP